MAMEAPLASGPALPPGVAGQMGMPQGGAGGLAGVTSRLGQQPQPGAADPNGESKKTLEAVERILTTLAQKEDKLKPYVARAVAILKAGLNEVTQQAGSGGAEPPAGAMSARGPEGADSTGFPG